MSGDRESLFIVTVVVNDGVNLMINGDQDGIRMVDVH